MSNDTHNLSYQKFQGLDYKITKLSQMIDELDIVAYQPRNAFNKLSKAYQDICERENSNPSGGLEDSGSSCRLKGLLFELKLFQIDALIQRSNKVNASKFKERPILPLAFLRKSLFRN